MNVLILGKDPTLFAHGDAAFGDTRRRHQYYARALCERRPDSELRILTYTPKGSRSAWERIDSSLAIYGTRSLHRAMFLVDAIRCLPLVLRHGWRPDIVTVQTPWEEGRLGLFLARATGAKFLPQLHFDLFSKEWYREHPLNRWRQRTAFGLLRRADGIRVVSLQQKQEIVKRLGVDGGRVHVVPVGVNFTPVLGEPSALRAAIAPCLQGKRIVLFVGRFVPSKNLPLWLDVAELVARRHSDVAFVLAGDGECMPSVRSRVEAAGLSGRFHFLGSVNHRDLPAIYACADLLLLSSNHEGFGRVIVEASLAGVPVVSTACAGPLDLIVSGETGSLAQVGDADGLSAAVSSLLENEPRRTQLAKAGKQRIQAIFSLESLTERLLDCWESI